MYSQNWTELGSTENYREMLGVGKKPTYLVVTSISVRVERNRRNRVFLFRHHLNMPKIDFTTPQPPEPTIFSYFRYQHLTQEFKPEKPKHLPSSPQYPINYHVLSIRLPKYLLNPSTSFSPSLQALPLLPYSKFPTSIFHQYVLTGDPH